MANFAVSHLCTGGEFEVLYKLWLFADVPLFGRPRVIMQCACPLSTSCVETMYKLQRAKSTMEQRHQLKKLNHRNQLHHIWYNGHHIPCERHVQVERHEARSSS